MNSSHISSSLPSTWTSAIDSQGLGRFSPKHLTQLDGGIELAFTTIAYLGLVPRILSFLRGFPTSKKGKIIGYVPPQMLVFHILVSVAIIARHLFRLATESKPTSTQLDLILNLSQAFSSWYLVRRTPWKSTLWKSSFQTVVPMYAFATWQAYTTKSPEWYSTSMAFLFWFVTIRTGFLFSLGLKFYPEVDASAMVHLTSVPVTLVWANWANTIPLYFLVLGIVSRLNMWVTKQVPHSEAPRSLPLNVLIALGFGEFRTTKPEGDTG
ncbi:hypothetical protein CKM354_000797600 [Cercospora kikuchii]|uniref:Uncharacterized protein n=1 Tax=Cercospora kikuchii TaxID=84275 RepID=A0A9P3CUY5_9PEZI|nr:uncharacterized protein CKM354_000797600 [Cercospora kikuchii]GIZ44788.1 hypothetical protein CKM354_000797600 [Cercospora kikuchii]